MRTLLAFTSLLACTIAVVGCNQPTTQQTLPISTPVAETPKPVSPPTPASRWNVSKEVNDLDGKAKISLSTYDFVFRCAPKLEGYIKPPIESLGHSLETEDGGGQTVRYRIDNSPIRKQHWSMSTDYEALFLPTATLREALKGKKLVVEYKPSYVVAKTETFDLEGLQDAARAAGCKI